MSLLNPLRRLFVRSSDSKHRAPKSKKRLIIISIVILGLLAASFDYPKYWNNTAQWVNQWFQNQNKVRTLKNWRIPSMGGRPFVLGLDLQGGVHLLYEADLSGIDDADKEEAMQGVRDVIERRVNLFGVTEPVVQVNKVGESWRLIVELAGIQDVKEAVKMIGETPSLDFRISKPEEETKELEKKQAEGELVPIGDFFLKTDLDGSKLKKAELDFDPNTQEPIVSLEFNNEGKDIFASLTKENIGKPLAIFLDDSLISMPTVREEITAGKAQISGNFTFEEAKLLVRRLNAGALPVPIKILSQQNIGASLGKVSLNKSLQAGVWGIILVMAFMVFYYRLPGITAVISLLLYIAFVLVIVKIIPVTLTLAGIAGFILSIGMAVDANVLIFERLKEELASGRSLGGSIDEGFRRAWPSIRDGNASTLITAVILYWFGTSFIKGFALTLGIGVVISMLTAIIVTRVMLKSFTGTRMENYKWIYGIKNNKVTQ